MTRRQTTFVNGPPVESKADNNLGSTGIVRTANIFIFIPDKPKPSYNRLVNISEDE